MEFSKGLLLDISQYLDFWNRCLNATLKIKHYAVEKNLDCLTFERENRQRLLNLLLFQKEKILGKLDQKDWLNNDTYFEDFFQKVQKSTSEISNLIQTIDCETLDLLSLEKLKTSKSISKISKLKNFFPS